MKNKKALFIVTGFLAVVIALTVIVKNFVPKPAATEGAKTVTVIVDSGDASTMTYTVNTDAEYLIDVMNEMKEAQLFTFEAENSEYGPYVTSINNKTADFNKDGAYWAIYVNGDYGQYGVSEQPVKDGETYSFVYEKQ